MHNADRYLILDLKEGSERSFEILYNKYQKRVFYFALGYLKDRDDAESLVQDVFVKLWTKREDIDENRSFSSFLFTIAKNKVLDLFKKRTHELNYKKHLANCFELIEERTNNDIVFSELDQKLTEVVNSLPKKRR